MIITSKVNMDLMQQPWTAAIHAVQDDRYSRNLEISLYSGNVPWNIPENVRVLIRYSKADGTGGEYDTLPDGTAAWSKEGNVLTAALAPQVLTAAGPVNLSVKLILEEKQLSTFSVLIRVHPAVGKEIGASADYFHVTAYLPAPASAEPGQYFRIASVDAQGKVTAVEAVNLEGGTGGNADPAEVQRIVEEYLEANPPAAGADGKDGTDGTDGADGISVTHRWNGTVLIVTSASGSSSADLKGAKGDKGDKGDQGATGAMGIQGETGPKGDTGADGYTPVRGTDYWTESDKNEIRAYVDNAILGGAW